MNKEQMRIAIAEHCGYRDIESKWLKNGTDFWCMGMGPKDRDFPSNVPDYLNDLNVMRDVEMSLPDNNSMHGLVVYRNKLLAVCGSHKACVSATAEQRAEAFLKTVDRWVEDGKVTT